jgi:hypothetical protein
MLKIVTGCVAATLVVCPLSLTPTARAQVETGAPTGAGNVAVKVDQPDVGAGACADRVALARMCPQLISILSPNLHSARVAIV